MNRELAEIDQDLRRELLSMKAEDLRVRDGLQSDGALGDGYHPTMEDVHRRNASRLQVIVEKKGWPGRALVDDDGAEAAWLILQHAIGEPDLQRAYLPLLLESAARSEIPLWQPAYLHDRICFFEGKPQIYGTQSDWDDEGTMALHPLQNPDQVNDLREQVGLPRLPETDSQESSRESISAENVIAHRRQLDAWARSVGWRK
jgi:hypothetical protein